MDRKKSLRLKSVILMSGGKSHCVRENRSPVSHGVQPRPSRGSAHAPSSKLGTQTFIVNVSCFCQHPPTPPLPHRSLIAPMHQPYCCLRLSKVPHARFASTSAGPYPFPTHIRPTPHQIFHLPVGASQNEIKARCTSPVSFHMFSVIG